MNALKLYLEEDLLDRVKKAAKEAGLSTNQKIVNILEENFQGQVSFDYPAVMEKLVKEAQSCPVGKEFVLSDLPSFAQVSVVTVANGQMRPSGVRAKLGSMFGQAVSRGKVAGVARATVGTSLRFCSGAAVYVRK